MIITLIILTILFIFKKKFNPSIDKTSEGDVLLWYDSGYSRNFIKIWKNNNNKVL